MGRRGNGGKSDFYGLPASFQRQQLTGSEGLRGTLRALGSPQLTNNPTRRAGTYPPPIPSSVQSFKSHAAQRPLRRAAPKIASLTR